MDANGFEPLGPSIPTQPPPEVGDLVFAPRAGLDPKRGLARVLRVLAGIAPIEIEYTSDDRRVWVNAKQIVKVDAATAISLAAGDTP